MKRRGLIAGAAGVLSGLMSGIAEATSMADIELIRTELDSAWAEWTNASLIAKWRQQNPGEASKLDAYRAGGAKPVMATATGKALVHETAAWFESGAVPEPPPDPPPPATDPTAYGYRPALPAGWTLVENKQLAQSDYNGKQKIMFRNCTGGAWFTNAATADLMFVDCDMRGGCGAFGKRISFYGCRFGQRVDADACQVRPNTSGGERPSDWLFQGCTFRDITRTEDKHTDAIQFGGVLGATVRHCYFDNIAVEMILCNGWNGKPENVTVSESFFGTRTDPGGPPIHFSHPGSSGQQHVWASTNCHAVDNYYDGVVAVLEPGVVGCSQSGTKPRSEWPHQLRADGWLDY